MEIEYTITLRGEDGMEFCASVHAEDRTEAYEKAEELYPESRVLEVASPADLRDRERAIYERASRDYEDGYYDDY